MEMHLWERPKINKYVTRNKNKKESKQTKITTRISIHTQKVKYRDK